MLQSGHFHNRIKIEKNATSSITKNFIISGQKQVEMFADAIEASANDRTPRVPINVTYLQGADDIIKFMEKRKKTDGISK